MGTVRYMCSSVGTLTKPSLASPRQLPPVNKPAPSFPRLRPRLPLSPRPSLPIPTKPSSVPRPIPADAAPTPYAKYAVATIFSPS